VNESDATLKGASSKSSQIGDNATSQIQQNGFPIRPNIHQLIPHLFTGLQFPDHQTVVMNTKKVKE